MKLQESLHIGRTIESLHIKSYILMCFQLITLGDNRGLIFVKSYGEVFKIGQMIATEVCS